MMNRVFRAEDFAGVLDPRLIPGTDDSEFLWDWLAKILGDHCDVEGVFYLAYPVGESGGKPETLITRAIWRTSYPQDYLEAMPGNPLTNDYSANHVLETGEVSRWHDPESPAKMTKGERERILLDEKFNMSIGACFPIFTSSKRICGGFGLRSKSQVAAVFDRVILEHGGEIGRLLSAFDEKFRGACARTQFRLAPQEARVLAYLAGGMAVQRLAHEMGLSPKTVEAYMSSARKKTSSSTSAEAVAKAIFFNLV
jgi:DNA-binding CsgD family transcriptional regulator